MSDEEETTSQLTDNQQIEIAKWFLLNSPAGEIQYVAKGKLSYASIWVGLNVYIWKMNAVLIVRFV